MKIKLSLEKAITLPIFLGLSVGMLYAVSHFGFNRIVVPEWYEIESVTRFPTEEVIEYWSKKAIQYGMITFIISLIVSLSIYFVTNKKTKGAN